MKHLIFLLTIATFIACSDDDTPNSTAMDIGITIEVLNQDNENLLNTNTSNYLNEDDIRFYKLVNNEETLIYNPNWDSPYGFGIVFDSEGDGYIDTGFLPNAGITFPEYIVKWSNTKQDTLKCEVEQLRNVLRFSKVWVNNELQWESTNQTERKVTIVIEE